MTNINDFFNESELVDAQLYDGLPTGQLRVKEGLFELPLDQFAGLLADDVEVRDFEHGDTMQKGYALQTLLIVPVIAQTSYVTKYKVDPKNPKSEVEVVVTPNYTNGSRSRVRALCLSPQIGTTIDGIFTPKLFILTIGGLQTKAFSQVFGNGRSHGDFYKTIARPISMLISPSGSKAFPDYAIACPLGFGAKDSFDLPDGSKLYYYPLAGGWTKDDLDTIKQLETMRPKAPTIGKAMPESVKTAKMKKYGEELAEFKGQVIDVIQKSELSRLFVGYNKVVPLLDSEIEKYNEGNAEFEATQREHQYYGYLTECGQLRLPKGILPMDILQNECDGNVSKALASIASQMELIHGLKQLPPANYHEPLPEASRLQLELDR